MPPIQIKSARVEIDSAMTAAVTASDPDHARDSRVLVLEYDLPSHLRPPGDAGSHNHAIPFAALVTRAAMYGSPTFRDALDECIHEFVSLGTRDPDKLPSHADRKASRQGNPIVGLDNALRKAGITLPTYPDDEVRQVEEHHLRRFGRDVVARARGIDPTALPDPRTWRPERGPLLAQRSRHPIPS